MIYHWGASLSEHACIADLMFCHGTQTMDNSRICHCLLFHEHGKQKLHGAISLVKKASYYATHT